MVRCYKPHPKPLNNTRMFCLVWLACASIEVAAWLKMLVLVSLLVSSAKSASSMRPLAASVLLETEERLSRV